MAKRRRLPPPHLLETLLLNAAAGGVGLGPVEVWGPTTAELVRASGLPWFTDRKGHFTFAV